MKFVIDNTVLTLLAYFESISYVDVKNRYNNPAKIKDILKKYSGSNIISTTLDDFYNIDGYYGITEITFSI